MGRADVKESRADYRSILVGRICNPARPVYKTGLQLSSSYLRADVKELSWSSFT